MENTTKTTEKTCLAMPRTQESARECYCDSCKKWWCEHVPGYFICSGCGDVILISTGQYSGMCERCYENACSWCGEIHDGGPENCAS